MGVVIITFLSVIDMKENIIPFPDVVVGDGVTVNPDDCLRDLIGELSTVVIIGLDHEGNLTGSASHGRPETITLLERGKLKLLNSYGDDDEP